MKKLGIFLGLFILSFAIVSTFGQVKTEEVKELDLNSIEFKEESLKNVEISAKNTENNYLGEITLEDGKDSEYKDNITDVKFQIRKEENTYSVRMVTEVKVNKDENGVYSTLEGIEYGFSIVLVAGETVSQPKAKIIQTYYKSIEASGKDLFPTDGYLYVTSSIYGIPEALLSSLEIQAKAFVNVEDNYYTVQERNIYMAEIEGSSIVNGDFEMAGLTGWKVTGENPGNTYDARSYWDQKFPRYVHGTKAYESSDVSTLTSTSFKVAEKGISLLLGCAKQKDTNYVEVVALAADNADLTEDVVYSTFVNDYFRDPYCALTMVYQSTILPEEALGKRCVVRIVDNAVGTGDFAFLTADDVRVNQTVEQLATSKEEYISQIATNIEEANANSAKTIDFLSWVFTETIFNGGFEMGLDGWTVVDGEYSGQIFETPYYWNDENRLVNNDGKYFSSVEVDHMNMEGRTGILRSSAFIASAGDWLSFKYGGGNQTNTYVRIINEKGEVVAVFLNAHFEDGKMNMHQYQFTEADLANGNKLFIEIFDKGTGGWGCLDVDSFELSKTEKTGEGIYTLVNNKDKADLVK